LYAYQTTGQTNNDTAAIEQAPSVPPSSDAMAADEDNVSQPPNNQAVVPAPSSKVPASPAVRRLVREHSLALSDISGSGKDGRVLKEDVLAHLNAPAVSNQTASVSMPSSTGLAPSKVEPLRGVRAVMAKRMVEAASSIPHFHYGEEIDVTELLALRERLKPQVEAKGERLTLMPFFMKAMALAVAET
ncbi:MAG TPA: dihydrolipoamide acetyltransferase, partial [Halomonas sp.]|nr:dihydrolipoamide acetyltransferase [Halomonas sp.]